jgi:hypothetical protein
MTTMVTASAQARRRLTSGEESVGISWRADPGKPDWPAGVEVTGLPLRTPATVDLRCAAARHPGDQTWPRRTAPLALEVPRGLIHPPSWPAGMVS